MTLNEEEFHKLTRLCKIKFSEEEKQIVLEKISKVIAHVAQLDELDTKDVRPCYQVVLAASDTMREDEEGPLLSREEFLANVPSHIGGMIKVPAVMKTST